MRVLQQYYTSYSNEETGSVGFQVKATSPGISTPLETNIARLISYRIPFSLNEQDIGSHPVALRYYYLGPDQSILLCSRSTGKDVNGRPGNFFAHTLIMEPEIFTSMPPIFYWKSPFWRNEDRESTSMLTSLPVLGDFDTEPSLDIEDVWSFLAQGERRVMLYKLLCAVIHSTATHRRIVILDNAENVAYWIAAVSCLLPPAYRPLLSFATYHHEPQQGLFLITGTTSDSSFRATSENYASYFILNAETGITSAVPVSPYARMAADAAQPDLYESQLLVMFTDYAKRFPAPATIDEQLDLMALYTRLQFQAPRNEAALEAEELQAIHGALSSFEEIREFAQEDIDELHHLQQVLLQAAQVQQNPNIQREHGRILALLKTREKQNVTLEEDQLKEYTEHLLRKREAESAVTGLAQLQETYSEEVLMASINRQTFLTWLAHRLENEDKLQLLLTWQYVGAYIQPGEQSQPFLITSLRMVHKLWKENQFTERNTLLATMWQAMQGRERTWLQLAVDSSNLLPRNILEIFYFSLVGSLDLERRVAFRSIIAPASKTILENEFNWDVARVGVQGGLVMIELWMRHAKQIHYDGEILVATGLNKLQKMSSPQAWQELAPQILKSSLLPSLPKKLEEELIPLALSTVLLSDDAFSNIELYTRYRNHPALSEDVKKTIAAILAMHTCHMDGALAQHVNRKVKMLLPEEYRSVIRRCLHEFFQHDVIDKAHGNLIAALFTRNHSYATYFWQTYWETFEQMVLSSPSRDKELFMLSFWFKLAPVAFQQQYIVQDCFLRLPAVLASLRQNNSARSEFREFSNAVARQPWYAAVQSFFPVKKGILEPIGQGLASFFQRPATNQHTDKEYEAEIQRLFTGNAVLEHSKQLSALYRQSHEQFWPFYWQGFKDFIMAGNADFTLDLLSFWFDTSFKTPGYIPYAPQEFLLGLPAVLERVRKEPGFHKIAHQIDERASQQINEGYSWYPLIEDFFAE